MYWTAKYYAVMGKLGFEKMIWGARITESEEATSTSPTPTLAATTYPSIAYQPCQYPQGQFSPRHPIFFPPHFQLPETSKHTTLGVPLVPGPSDNENNTSAPQSLP